MRARSLALVLAAAALGGCGSDGSGQSGSGTTPRASGSSRTTTVPAEPSRVEAITRLGKGGFDPSRIYRQEAPGVVTVISVLGGGATGRGLGTGFVISGKGEVATNAHVVTDGEGSHIARAKQVFVQFGDGNEVAARVVGTDPNSDVALLRIDPSGLTLRPLPLGSSAKLTVGDPVAAIGSPFAEPQSLSVGVISATGRTIDSLTGFSISGAIQTDAAINRGNSGGPLVDARGAVLGINSQIQSTGGGGEGVGFAVPIDTIKRSLTQLRAHGRVAYAYIGVSSVPVYPQLARRFGLGASRGAYVQSVTPGSPARRAGLRGGSRRVRFQAEDYRVGGDVITRVGDITVREESDLARAIERRRPGQTVRVELWRDGRRRSVEVKLSDRPAQAPSAGRP